MLYGIRPAQELAPEVPLRPVMSVRTRVVALRPVRPGEAVGYGATFRARRPGRIATLPLGYGDGVPWHLGGCGVALVGGRRFSFAGRVSMDYVTLDVGDAPVAVGDEALLFGVSADGAGRLPVEEQAGLAGTIPYELVSRIAPRLPRVLVAG
jgi:alanine racemase